MFGSLSYKQNVPLGPYSTMGIGGPATYFLEIKTIEQLAEALHSCHTLNLPFFLLGKGSNTLFSDRGFNGAVLLNKIDFCQKDGKGAYFVGAGYSFALLGVQTARDGWSGLEFASGIPASVGGAIYMNAGANGAAASDALTSVAFVTMEGKVVDYAKDELSFAYRTSTFQRMQGAIAGGKFLLKPCCEARKRQLDIVQYRVNTQPYHEKSAGCIFRNPACGHAGQLIEQCGLKGKAIGPAQVSPLHANFIVNKGGATAAQIVELIAFVQETVKRETSVELETEVRVIPDGF